MKKLNDKHQRFVAEYLVDLNATAAYKRAGYKATDRAATVNAARLLTNADIAAAIAKGQEKVLQKIELTAERVLQEVARIAFFDVRKMFDADGNPIPVHKLDADTASVISGIDVQEIYEGSGADRVFVGHIKKYKISDKNVALGNSLKILGLLREKLEVSAAPEVIDPLEGARRMAFILRKGAEAQAQTIH